MRVRVRLFAVAKQLAGTDEVTLEVPEGSTLAKLRLALAAEVPAIASVLPHILFAAGSEYVTDDSLVPANGELACIPPVSGG